MDGSDGRRLSLDGLDGTAEDLRYRATLTTEAGECTVGVWEYNSGLAAFVRSLANDWAGFPGERSYTSIEGHLTLVCRHDGRGTVGCRVTIGQVWPPQWSMAADLDFGAGAHLERIADVVERFFPAAEPVR
jgi:Family of unknown function (DUF6228)